MTVTPPLFHWAPTARRASIERIGLVPGRRSNTLPQFRPPYVCLGTDPRSAWSLSGAMCPEITAWDLWQVSLADGHDVRQRDDEPREWRVYDRIFKQGVWLVATRTT